MRPLNDFLKTEAAGGVVLFIATVTALMWANLPLVSDSYGEFWTIKVNLLDVSLPLVKWVNDGLMAVFFLVVGLEIKRELVSGELARPRSASLPVVAALGGMAVPALLYLALNGGREGASGWGIPMATDIAFVLGVLALLGRRVPPSLKTFLLAVAIVDDIGAILLIALVYTDDLSLLWLGAGVVTLGLGAVLLRVGIDNLVVYAAVGLVAWIAVHESGVHATLVGVLLGLITPARPDVGPAVMRRLGARVVASFRSGSTAAGAADLEGGGRERIALLERLEHTLHPWSSFAIVPVFALANAGVKFDGDAIEGLLTSRVSLGVIVGLVVGKLTGILLSVFAATKIGISELPQGTGWLHMVAAGLLAGIGFTVAIFIGSVAFDSETLVVKAKLGIFGASMLAGAAGYLLMRVTAREVVAN